MALLSVRGRSHARTSPALWWGHMIGPACRTPSTVHGQGACVWCVMVEARIPGTTASARARPRAVVVVGRRRQRGALVRVKGASVGMMMAPQLLLRLLLADTARASSRVLPRWWWLLLWGG